MFWCAYTNTHKNVRARFTLVSLYTNVHIAYKLCSAIRFQNFIICLFDFIHYFWIGFVQYALWDEKNRVLFYSPVDRIAKSIFYIWRLYTLAFRFQWISITVRTSFGAANFFVRLEFQWPIKIQKKFDLIEKKENPKCVKGVMTLKPINEFSNEKKTKVLQKLFIFFRFDRETNRVCELSHSTGIDFYSFFC